jgi:hypothetical protein
MLHGMLLRTVFILLLQLGCFSRHSVPVIEDRNITSLATPYSAEIRWFCTLQVDHFSCYGVPMDEDTVDAHESAAQP